MWGQTDWQIWLTDVVMLFKQPLRLRLHIYNSWTFHHCDVCYRLYVHRMALTIANMLISRLKNLLYKKAHLMAVYTQHYKWWQNDYVQISFKNISHSGRSKMRHRSHLWLVSAAIWTLHWTGQTPSRPQSSGGAVLSAVPTDTSKRAEELRQPKKKKKNTRRAENPCFYITPLHR